MQDTPEIVSPPNEDYSEEAERQVAIAADRRWLGVGVLLLIMVVGVMGGVWYFQRIGESENRQVSKPVEQPISAPVEAAKPVEDQNYVIEILNGSGVTGAAGAAKSTLGAKSQESNLKIEVTTGNAPAQKGTTISYRSTEMTNSRLAKILDQLYPDAIVSVAKDLFVDIVIVIGK